MKKVNFVSRAFNKWAFHSKVRVFVCGTGGSASEWDSLRSSFYADLKPTVQRVFDVNEADLIALHGPISDCILIRIEELVRTHQLPVVAIGNDFVLDELGYLINGQGEASEIRVTSQLINHLPEPQDLQALVKQVVQSV